MSKTQQINDLHIALKLIKKLAMEKWVAVDKKVESERRQKVLDDIVRQVDRVLG